ncbi:hypothetical protein [Aeromonas molluscorum]
MADSAADGVPIIDLSSWLSTPCLGGFTHGGDCLDRLAGNGQLMTRWRQ